jgi:integrase/recombinase XerD
MTMTYTGCGSSFFCVYAHYLRSKNRARRIVRGLEANILNFGGVILTRKKRTNTLSVGDITKLKGSLRTDYLDFNDALEIFIKDGIVRNLREHTLKFYRNELITFRNNLVAQSVTTYPVEITQEIINENVISYLRIEKELKSTSINARLRAIRAFFNFLYKKRYIPHNPVEGLSLVRDRKPVIATFSIRQINAILNEPDLRTFVGVRDYTLMLLLLETGVRVHELVGVKVADINWDESKLLIRNTKGYLQQFVPLSATMKEQLRRYLAIRGSIEDCDALFITLLNTPLTKRQIQSRISFYGKEAEMRACVAVRIHSGILSLS